jgi:hypothetical protein
VLLVPVIPNRILRENLRGKKMHVLVPTGSVI